MGREMVIGHCLQIGINDPSPVRICADSVVADGQVVIQPQRSDAGHSIRQGKVEDVYFKRDFPIIIIVGGNKEFSSVFACRRIFSGFHSDPERLIDSGFHR